MYNHYIKKLNILIQTRKNFHIKNENWNVEVTTCDHIEAHLNETQMTQALSVSFPYIFKHFPQKQKRQQNSVVFSLNIVWCNTGSTNSTCSINCDSVLSMCLKTSMSAWHTVQSSKQLIKAFFLLDRPWKRFRDVDREQKEQSSR